MLFTSYRCILLLVIVLSTSSSVRGQIGYLDSTRIACINHPWNDSAVENYDQWLTVGIQINHDSIGADLERLRVLSEKSNSSFGYAVYQSNFAYWYAEKTGDYEKSLSLALEAKKTFEIQKSNRQLIVCLCRIAFFKLWNEIGSNTVALDQSILDDYLLPAKSLAESTQDIELQVTVNQWIGSYFNVSRKDNEKALFHFSEAERMDNTNKNSLLYLTTIASIGILYAEMCNEQKALNYLEKSKSNPFSAQYPYALGNLNRAIAQYYLECKRDYAEALIYAQNAYALAIQLQAPEYKGLCLNKIYQIYKAMGDKEQALVYLELYNAQEKEIARDKFEFAYSQYNIQNKEKFILQQQVALQQKNVYVILISAIFLLVIIALIVIYKVREKNRMINLREREENYRITLEKTVRATEEEERKRIAENLHDSVVQKLVVAKMNVESIQKNNHSLPEENKAIVNNIHSLLEDSTTEIRSLSHTLMPASFDIVGLSGAVKELSYKTINSEIKIEVFENGNIKLLPKNLAIVAYRIIQECVQNTIKHSQAKNIFINISLELDRLEISVEDDGVGFKKTEMNFSGIGLRSIQERIENLKGIFELETEINKGTCIQFSLPINN
jgi:signal transduction histidine kinase